MLNNIFCLALHVFNVLPSFAISNQGCSDAFDWFFCLNLQRCTSALSTAWFKKG